VLAILVLAAAAVLAAYLDPAPPALEGRAQASDGDSFRLGEQRVRLLGIDAPELRQTCRDEAGDAWPCGLQARDYMASLLRQGQVDCRPEEHDQYGRLLAECTIGELDLAGAMVSKGLAISSGRYQAQEHAARQARIGIWRGEFDAPRDWRRDHEDGHNGPSWLSILGL
jgi:endonuclease YncB( thermonuclease family)